MSNTKNHKDDHSHSHDTNQATHRREVIAMVLRLVSSALFIVLAKLIESKTALPSLITSIHPTVLYSLSYLMAGYDVLLQAAKNISRGKIFDENFLMSIATIGALILQEYTEAVAVMAFYQVGEIFQNLAVNKSKASIAELMDIRPDHANIEKDGILTKVSPEEVKLGDIIVVTPGEKVPLDGVVIEGESSLDTRALTGESNPRTIRVGNDILSGCVNISGVLKIKVNKLFGESTVSKILQLVQYTAGKKAKAEKFITRFARYYTPAVVFAAVVLAVIPPLFFGGAWSQWIERALIFLVISCPCALVISVPLGFFAGIGCASKNGILIKGSSYLEALSKIETTVFDKTGTLTKGVFTVVAVHADTIDKKELLELTALAETYSNHPISISIKDEYQKQSGKEAEKLAISENGEKRVTDIKETPGLGIEAKVDGKTVHAGNSKLMERVGAKWIKCSECNEFGTLVHVAVDGIYTGHIFIADEAKPEAAKAILELKSLGIKKTVMLTGDEKGIGEHIGKQLGIDVVYASLLPEDKVSHLEKLLDEVHTHKGATLAFAGDGINDAPVLALADIGIAMGAMGSDAAIEAADVVLMDDNPEKLPLAVNISRRTLAIVKENIILALGIKAIVMILGTVGLANMWTAVFADTGVSLLAVLNSMRAMKIVKKD